MIEREPSYELARALLTDTLGDLAKSEELYRAFRWEVLTPLPKDKGFVFSQEKIRQRVEHLLWLKEKGRG